jgi:hypothetical protein
MKHFVITLAASAIMMTFVMAQKVGVSMAYSTTFSSPIFARP